MTADEATYQSLPGEHPRAACLLGTVHGRGKRRGVDVFRNYLHNQPELARLRLGQWQEMLRESQQRGLLRPHPADPGSITISPALTVILRYRHQYLLPPDVRNAVEKAFYLTYDAGARWMCKLFQSGIPAELEKAQAVAYLEYENLRTALELALRTRRRQAFFMRPLVATEKGRSSPTRR